MYQYARGENLYYISLLLILFADYILHKICYAKAKREPERFLRVDVRVIE